MIENIFIERFGKNKQFTRYKITGNKYPTMVSIDTEDEFLFRGNHKWTSTKDGYIRCTVHGNELLHRLVISAKKGDIVDHKNRNPSDNRKINLRIVSHRENMMNRSASYNSQIPVKGVYLDRQTWRSEITVNGKLKRLGSYDDLYDAVCSRIRAEIIEYKDKSFDYKHILKEIPALYLKFWFPEIYGKGSHKNAGDEFVNSFFNHSKEDNSGIRKKLKRYSEKAKSDARYQVKKQKG